MSKNWDKPLSYSEYENGPLDDNLAYHGVSLESEGGQYIYGLFGHGPEEDYGLYLGYCKLMSTPLGQALS